MRLMVNNIKISCKVPPRPLTWIEKRCERRKIYFRKFANFTQLYFTESKLRVSFFTKSLHRKQHCNATGIRSFEKIQSVIEIISELLSCSSQDIVHTVDNITANGSLGQSLSLLNDALPYLTAKKYSWRYDPQLFSGVIISFPWGTGILYSSGKFVVVGGRTLAGCQLLEDVVQDLHASIETK